MCHLEDHIILSSLPGSTRAIHSVAVVAIRQRNGMDAMVKPWHDDIHEVA